MNERPGRILQYMDRITQIQVAEFDDLTPPDIHYALSVLAWTYIEMFSNEVAGKAKRG